MVVHGFSVVQASLLWLKYKARSSNKQRMSAKLNFRPQDDHSPKTQPHAVGHEIRVASSTSVAVTDLLSKEKNIKIYV